MTYIYHKSNTYLHRSPESGTSLLLINTLELKPVTPLNEHLLDHLSLVEVSYNSLI